MCARLNPLRIFTVNFKIVGCDRSGYLSLHLVANAQRWRRFFKRVQTGMSSNFVKPASWKGEWNRENLSLAQIVISSLWSQGLKPLVKFKTSRFRTRSSAVSLCVFISHWIKASCAANRVVSVGRLNWQKLFTESCNQITIFQLRPHGLHLNAICLGVHGTLEPYIMSLVLFMRLEIAPCKILLPLLAAGSRLKGTICRHAVCGVLDLITPAITGRAVRPWYVTSLLHARRCGQNRMRGTLRALGCYTIWRDGRVYYIPHLVNVWLASGLKHKSFAAGCSGPTLTSSVALGDYVSKSNKAIEEIVWGYGCALQVFSDRRDSFIYSIWA